MIPVYQQRTWEENTTEAGIEMKLLEAQEKELPVAGINDNKESLFEKKSGNDTLDDKWMEGKKTPAKGNLKAPPAYSLIDNGDNVKETIVCGKTNAEKSVRDDSVFVVSGTQIDNNKKDFRKIEFRGLYRPSSASIKRLHLICSIQANDGEASSAAMTSGAVAATSVAAAASKKRNRSDVDDDDSIGATGGVAYQELFALHDDSRLSTEDLRRKYYGSGDRNEEDTNTKKRASKGTCNTRDDDGDDAYGFWILLFYILLYVQIYLVVKFTRSSLGFVCNKIGIKILTYLVAKIAD